MKSLCRESLGGIKMLYIFNVTCSRCGQPFVLFGNEDIFPKKDIKCSICEGDIRKNKVYVITNKPKDRLRGFFVGFKDEALIPIERTAKGRVIE